jgi:hypothetical protein
VRPGAILDAEKETRGVLFFVRGDGAIRFSGVWSVDNGKVVVDKKFSGWRRIFDGCNEASTIQIEEICRVPIFLSVRMQRVSSEEDVVSFEEVEFSLSISPFDDDLDFGKGVVRSRVVLDLFEGG